MIINSNTASQQFSSLNGAIKVNQNDVKVNSYTSNYDKEAYVLDISSRKINLSDKAKAIIQSNNGYVDKNNEAVHKILDDYYKKVVEDNKKFEDPLSHVYEKYNDKNYAYYVKDLTQDERTAAFKNEFNRQKGFKGSYSYLDPILARNGIKPTNIFVEKAERNAYNREAVNNQFETLLSNYGITIPQDEKLAFTIEPNYFTLKVNGAKDENLAQAIEDILNGNKANTKELFFHIIQSKFEDNSQFTKEKQDKFTLINSVREVTGYNLADLEVKGDKFLTPYGKDVFEVFKNNFGWKIALKENERNNVLIDVQNKLTDLARKGFENVADLVLSIDYENGSFYDVGQSENFGTRKTDWIDKMKEKLSNFDINTDISVLQKAYLVNETKEITGLNLYDLKIENGNFLTNDGRNIFDIYKNEIKNRYSGLNEFQDMKIERFSVMLQNIMNFGFDKIPNF